ncbi:MAG: hypothetical protein D6798_16885 [Deltaproteobacteria bacterium]|nr:MAG: hypothetical protein D6798_16885 [Deltaproteobacteria bacterium]
MTRFPIALVTLLATACISPKPADTDDGDGGSGGTTIADIQRGDVAEDSIVTLHDVVVTSELALDGGGFYIQDAGGGEYSGIYVYLQGTFDGLYLSIGDRIDITGTYTEYYGFSELTVGGMDDIEITGTAEVTATPVSDVTDWEPWEGVLVTLSDQTVLACPDTYGEAEISAGIELNDQLYEYEADRNATIAELTGLIEYSFEEWKIDPRSADDLAGFVPGDGCDFTIPEVHDMAEGQPTDAPVSLGSVELLGVVATSGLTSTGTPGFFVQQEGGGEKSGLFVYLDDKSVDLSAVDVQEGDVLDLTGNGSYYYGFVELAVFDNADIVKTGDTAPTTVDVLDGAPDDWAPWQGALVQLVEPTATGEQNSYGECPLDYGINLDDWFTSYEAGTGTTWDSITGLITYSYGEYGIQPRSEDDLVGGTGGGGGTGTKATVADIQEGTVAEDTLVTLTGVVATTSSDLAHGSGFFVQDAGGGAYSGIFVYTNADVAVAEGDELTLTGTVTEYYGMTELSVSSASNIEITGSGMPVTIDALDAVPSDWEPWEGCLVQLAGDVQITGKVDTYGSAATDWDSLYIDDTCYDWDDTYGTGDSFPSLTGVITYSYDLYRINPRGVDDLSP